MHIDKSINIKIDEFYIRIVDLKDAESLQYLCEKCTDYYDIVEGRLPPKNAAKEILEDIPADRSYEDKFVFGVFNKNDEIVAVVDLLRNYPAKGAWWIGLLMINPQYRGIGLGKKINDFIKDLAACMGGKYTGLGVAETNLNAFGFWSALGYEEERRTKPMKLGEKESVVIVMKASIKDMEISVGAKYRHFKGKEYKVLYIAKHSETLEDMVVYQALYGEMGIWVRPLDMFLEKKLVDGKIVNRFEKIEETIG